MTIDPPGALREQLARGPVLAPGVHNALFAKLVEATGFGCVHLSGAGTAARRGYPDVGLLTRTEVLADVRAVCGATRLPVIADADDGYGGVARTVREWERAGVAGLQLTDRVVLPGRPAGPAVLPTEEAVARVRAAVEARRMGVVVIARTDGLAIGGWEDVVTRALACLDAGADLIHVAGIRSRDDLDTYVRELVRAGVPCAYDGTLVPPAEVEQLGFALHLLSDLTVAAVHRSATEANVALRDHGSIGPVVHRYDPTLEARGIKEILADVGGINELLGLSDVYEFERRYAAEPEPGVAEPELGVAEAEPGAAEAEPGGAVAQPGGWQR